MSVRETNWQRSNRSWLCWPFLCPAKIEGRYGRYSEIEQKEVEWPLKISIGDHCSSKLQDRRGDLITRYVRIGTWSPRLLRDKMWFASEILFCENENRRWKYNNFMAPIFLDWRQWTASPLRLIIPSHELDVPSPIISDGPSIHQNFFYLALPVRTHFRFHKSAVERLCFLLE